MDIMTILYGKSGDGGVSQNLRDSLNEIFQNYMKDFSDEELKSFLSQIDDDDDFPEFAIDWYEYLSEYMEEERGIEID